MQQSSQSQSSISSQNVPIFSQQELLDQLSIPQTNLQSINTFLNSYQILKKWENPVIDIRDYLENKKINTYFPHQTKKSNTFCVIPAQILAKENNSTLECKQYDEISEREIIKEDTRIFNHNKSNCSDVEGGFQLISGLKLPADNQFIVLQSHIKCTNLLSRVRSLNSTDNLSQRPMFIYPQWKQVSQGVKKIFNKILQISVKELNTGKLITLRPKQSLSIRTDYYCFHPHQVYTTFLALDKTSIESGTLGFCRLERDFIESQFPKYNDELEMLDVINKEKKELEWEYIELKEGNLIVLGKDVIYGSFRNDTPSTKFFAEMKWVKNQSASNSSNSS